MQINLDNQLINIEIIRKNNKRIYFRYKDDNILYIYAPSLISKNKIIDIIKENKTSILKMINSNIEKQEDENIFYYLGNKYEIVYSDIKEHLFDEDTIFIKDKKSLDKLYKSECIRIFSSYQTII